MSSERYQCQEKLGEGQMSVVWQALDTYTQEQVALKIMTGIPEDDRRNQKARERFHREIDIARMMKHEHILPILDYGYMEYEKRRTPYLVLPYIGDRSLVDVIKARPPWQHWSLLQIMDALMQAAGSLWYLHSQQPPIVHEDVKPGNFLCRVEDTAERMVYLYLCDFGISRWKQDAPEMASELLGTFQFMAPEQFERKVDCASDQYALAVMACLMLTGKLPIQAATHDLYPDAHLHDPPQRPSDLNPERIQSPEIDAVILRALEKQPVKRYPSVIAFARALQQAVMDYAEAEASAPTDKLPDLEPIFDQVESAQLVSPVDPVKPVDVARFVQLVSSVDPVKPVSLATSASSINVASASDSVETTLSNAGKTSVASPAPSLVADFADLFISLDPPEVQEDGLVLDEPLPLKPRKVVASAARSEDNLFAPLRLAEPARLFLPARPRQLAWSPDGSRLACALYGHVPVAAGGNGVIQDILTSHAERATSLCWSPDSTVVAVASPGELRFWDVTTQSALPLVLNFNVRTLDALSWSVGGQLAVWLADQILIYILERAQLETSAAVTPQRIGTNGMRCASAMALCWSPDGALLAAGASNGSVRCWSVLSHQPPWSVAAPGQKVSALAWSPASSLLLAAFRDNRVVGWDASARQETVRWSNLPAMPRTLTVSTSGRIIVASNERRLLVGLSSDLYPTEVLPGQLLVASSPHLPELATLDEQREHVLTIWRDV
jgi:serine/threonine protein kinase